MGTKGKLATVVSGGPKRVYYVKVETGEAQSDDLASSFTLHDWRIKQGYKQVTAKEYRTFRKEHAGPRSITLYLSDDEHTILRTRLQRLSDQYHTDWGDKNLAYYVHALLRNALFL